MHTFNRSSRHQSARRGKSRGTLGAGHTRLRPRLEALEDRRLLAAELVSVTTPPASEIPEAGSDYSTNPAISDDGRFVAFQSHAPNLVSGSVSDTNGTQDVFVRDLAGGTTTLISLNSDGTDSATCSGTFCGASLEGGSHAPAISGDGRYVAFVSSATDLVEGVEVDITPNVFVRDRDADEDGIFDEATAGATTTTLLSIGVDGTAAGVVGGAATRPVISANGMFVVFASSASDVMVDDATIVDTNGSGRDVYRASVLGGAVTRINVDGTGVGTGAGGGTAIDFSISADGSMVTFSSTNAGLISAASGTFNDTNGRADVFVGRGNMPVDIVSANSSFTAPGSDSSREAAISPNGRHVAFFSSATNLAAGAIDTNFVEDLFVRDLKTGVTTLVSRDRTTPGTLATGDGATPPSTLLDSELTAGPAISDTGRFIAFRSSAENLLDPSLGVTDANSVTDVFLFDRDSDLDGRFDEPGATTTRLVTLNNAGTASADHTGGGPGSSGSSSPSISRDGRYVAFSSTGRDLIPGGTPLPGGQVYLGDMVNGITTLISETSTDAAVGPTGTTPPTRTVVLSRDGNRVAFQTDTPADLLDASVADPASGSPVPFAEIDVFAAAPPTDIVLSRNFADGLDRHLQSFRVHFEDAGEFDVGYYLSADSTFDPADTLLGTLSITDPDDFVVDGNRIVTATIGSSSGEIAFPGVVTEDLSTDYFILTVADPANAIAESDADPFNEDNTSELQGVYHLPMGPVFAHGSSLGESITLEVVGDALELDFGFTGSTASKTLTYDLSDVPEVRLRMHGGDDAVTGSDLPEVVFGGDGSDSLSGGGGDDILFGGPGKDFLFGGDGADMLDGGSGPDVLVGGDGPDTFFDGPGDDLVDVGPGDDVVMATPGSDDIFIDAGGIDLIDFSLADLSIDLDLDSTATQLVDGNNTVQLIGQWENLVGSPLDDSITVSPLPGVERDINGGDGTDQVIVDAGGNRVISDGSTLSFPGTNLGDIVLAGFERVFVTNSSPGETILDDSDPAPGFTAPGFTCIDFSNPPCNAAAQQGFDGSVLISEANEGNTATWTFSNLTPGAYSVATTWTAGEGRASSVPYTIRDGGASGSVVAEVAVNQELEPGEFQDAGVSWQNLGLVEITGNTLTVELTDVGADATANDPNEFVIADAVRIEPLATQTERLPVFIDDAPNQTSPDRTEPATIREITGFDLTTLGLTINAFRVDLGGVDNGDLPPRSTGSRSISWDEITDLNASPEFIPLDLYNSTFPRGLQLHTSGQGIQISKSPTPGPRFSNLNNTYLSSFSAASPFRLMTPIGDNVVDVSFFVPGTNTPAAVNGFGAIFTDVDNAFTTRMQFFDATGTQIASRFVPATAGEGSLSFTGLSFEDSVVTRVRITAGDGPLQLVGSPNDVSLSGGEADLVVMDNFYYGEPQHLPAASPNGGFSSDCGALSGPGFLGDQHFCNAPQQATFDFGDETLLKRGTYLVSTTWDPQTLLSDEVNYQIDNGSEQVGVNVNQQNAPDDFTEAGISWERLAKVTVIDGQPPVVTVSSPTGGSFIADAIRFDEAGNITTTCDATVCWGSATGPFPQAAIDSMTGEATLSQQLVIHNTGLAPLLLSNFQTTGMQYTVDVTDTASVVPPGGSTSVRIDFSASDTGQVNGRLIFETNDFDHPTFELDLTTQVVVDNTPPEVAFVSPDDGASFVEGSTISLTLDAADDVQLREVDLIVDGRVEQTISSAPFEFSFTLPLDVDTVDLAAIARDVAGNESGQTAITIDLLEDEPPVVQFSSPSDSQGVVAGSTLQVRIDAVDDVDLRQVELLINGVTFGTGSFAPFVFDVPVSSMPGEQLLEACAVDSLGQETCQSINFDTFAGPVMTRGNIVVAPEAGGRPRVRVFDSDGATQFSFFAYQPDFTGGVRVATGDINGDGVEEIITGAGPGGGPHVKVFDGTSGQLLRSFFAYPSGFNGGVYVASGDVTGDGAADIITGAGPGGGPHVRVFDGVTGQRHSSFFAFDPAFRGGVRVAVGDVTGDGQADIVTGADAGGGPRVRVFDGHTSSLIPDSVAVDDGLIADFFAYENSFSGGVFVSAGDLNGDGRDDIVVGAGRDAADPGGRVKAIDAKVLSTLSPGQQIANQDLLADFFAFEAGFNGGVRVAVGDIDADGFGDIITGAGPGSNSVRVFDASDSSQLKNLNLGTDLLGSTVVSSTPPVFDVVNVVSDKPLTNVVREGDDLVIRDQDGNELFRRPAEDPKPIRINAPASLDNELVLQKFGSTPLPRIVFDGGIGGFDSVTLQGDTESDPVEYVRVNFLNPLNTSYSIDPSNPLSPAFLAVDLEPIDDRLIAVDREFAFADNDDNVLFNTGQNAADTVLRIDGDNSEVTDYQQPSGTTTVMLGDGADRFSFDVAINLLPIVDGQDGIDTLVTLATGQHFDLTDAATTAPRNIEVIDLVVAIENELTISGQNVIDVTDAGDTLVLRHDANDTVNYTGDGWQLMEPIFVDGRQRHVLVDGDARIETINGTPFQNPLEPTDANRSGETTSLDALQILNFLGRFDTSPVNLPPPSSESELPTFFPDTNGSETATALDALRVINFVASQLTQMQNEGEPPLVTQVIAPGVASLVAPGGQSVPRPSANVDTSSSPSLDPLPSTNRDAGIAPKSEFRQADNSFTEAPPTVSSDESDAKSKELNVQADTWDQALIEWNLETSLH